MLVASSVPLHIVRWHEWLSCLYEAVGGKDDVLGPLLCFLGYKCLRGRGVECLWSCWLHSLCTAVFPLWAEQLPHQTGFLCRKCTWWLVEHSLSSGCRGSRGVAESSSPMMLCPRGPSYVHSQKCCAAYPLDSRAIDSQWGVLGGASSDIE